MGRTFIGNLKGPQGNKGDTGDQGLPGVNAVPTDEAIAANLLNSVATDTQAALRRRSLPNGGLYMPSEYASLVWRGRRDRAREGSRQAHIAVLGDSIASTALPLSAPKYEFNWPGRLREMIAGQFGDAGTGVVILDTNIRTNPTWDDRLAYDSITVVGYGFHQAAAARMTAGVGWVDFTSRCDKFVIYSLPGAGGANTANVDGVSAGTFRNVASGGPAITLPNRTGYHPNHVVTDVPAGAIGDHTLRFVPAAGQNATLIGVEALVSNAGSFRVSNPSISGKSLLTLGANGGAANDETAGLFGLPLIDMLRADILVIALGINDWTGGRSIADLKANLTTLIRRQRATGTASGGGANAGGDVLLVWNPQPDVAALQPVGGPTWDEYREAYYEVADTENCPLLDMGERWKDYALGNAMGLFGDGIHPSDRGSLDIAPAVFQALMGV